MMEFFDGLTLELVPHCASVRPDGWTEDHDVRPLTALRCLQTIQPLAHAAGLPITELAELLDTRGFAEPRQWTQDTFRPAAEAIGGGWAAGHGLRALTTMAQRHPRGRVAAASHGDVIPLSWPCCAQSATPPCPDGQEGAAGTPSASRQARS